MFTVLACMKIRQASLFLLLFTASLVSCSKSRPVPVEAPPNAQPSPVADNVVTMPAVVAPKLSEVVEAVQRVFKSAAVIDQSVTPSFVAGDFNGDSTQDIAVVIKPAPGKLAEMNEQYPSWMRRDGLLPQVQRSGMFKVNENEQLLAIIHGYGPNDWRDLEATQTFLLKNAVGANLQTHAGKEVPTTIKAKRLPPIRGDFIGETVRGTPGYIYYSVKTYAWFDPKTYKGEPAAGAVHPIMAKN